MNPHKNEVPEIESDANGGIDLLSDLRQDIDRIYQSREPMGLQDYGSCCNALYRAENALCLVSSKAQDHDCGDGKLSEARTAHEHVVDLVAQAKALAGEMQLAHADNERHLGVNTSTMEDLIERLRGILHLADVVELVLRRGVIGEQAQTAEVTQ